MNIYFLVVIFKLTSGELRSRFNDSHSFALTAVQTRISQQW